MKRIAVALLSVGIASVANGAPKADHLVFMVFDQMRPDYVDRYDLKNFKRLRSMSLNYKNAYVGHLGADTVVSHIVMSSGRLPKDLPWQDEVFKDTKNVLGGGAGKFYVTGDLKFDQFMTAMKAVPNGDFLPQKIKNKLGGKVFAVGEKLYATVLLGSPYSDSIVTFKKSEGICAPTGLNVPNYISENQRYTVDCKKTYGTDGSLYVLDGARSVPGDDLRHQGGDVWVADIALEVMKREKDWRGIFLTFAGIDRMGHLTGDLEGEHPHSFDSKYTFADALRIADAQLGRILDELRAQGLLSRTLIVQTSDHGAQRNEIYLGNGGKSHGGHVFGEGDGLPQPFFVERILKTRQVAANYQDSAMRFWLADASSNTKPNDLLVRMMAETSGLVQVFRLSEQGGRYRYRSLYANFTGQSKAFRSWAQKHYQELADSMAAENSAELVGLLGDGVGFDLPGDHGGAQEKGQRIPMFFAGPGVNRGVSATPIRLVDLNAQISKLMGL